MAWPANRIIIVVALAAGLIAASCGSSTTSATTTSTTIGPADLPWVEDFLLDDTGSGEIAFGSDSTQLFMTGPGAGAARVWDLETKTKTDLDIGAERNEIAVSSEGLVAITIDENVDDGSDRRTVAAKGVRIWDPETGQKLHDLFKSRLGHQVFSPDGKLVVANNWVDDETHQIIVWDVKTGEIVQTFGGHTESIGDIKFTPDGKKILSGSSDGLVRIWDTETGRQLSVLDHTENGDSSPRLTAISPDGKFFVANNNGGNEVWLWDLETETVVKKLQPGIEMNGFFSFDFSSDGKQLAAGGLGVSVLWDVETGEVIQEFPPSHPSGFVNVAFSPDGKHLAVTDIADERGIGQYTAIYKQNPK